MFFQHQSPILRKNGKGIGEDQSVGVVLKSQGLNGWCLKIKKIILRNIAESMAGCGV